MHMSEIEETAREYGRKIAASASQAHDYLHEKATLVGEKIKERLGSDCDFVMTTLGQAESQVRVFEASIPLQKR